ncbi:MAG TPA: nickel pincer cofactor biosynthesis protein LarC [Candidatus Kryptonia bacterium]|nr:nickel pincer cofactor biosynthesis protein LarC [Candidatus Kryptonia bacterium]
MRIAYFDAFSGVSGDMTVGALLALGVPLERVRAELRRLPIGGYEIAAEPVHVNGIAATHFIVRVESTHQHGHEHSHRPYRVIRALIEDSQLSAPVKQKAQAIFARLAEAESRVHAIAPDDVEFHEVGAVDAIVDIVATAVGFCELGIDAAYVSPLPTGSGIVRSQHGPLPIPAPATVELLRGFPLRTGDGEGELVTPTGAAIVATLARPGAPPLRIDRVGYGAGTRRLADRPNLLRLVLGEAVAALGGDELVLIETNIDDANPELYDHVMERLLAEGARDVYLTPVLMKKNRPGIVLSVLSEAVDRERLAEIVLTETTAIGVRYHSVQRTILAREVREVMTEFGAVRVKIAHAPDGRENLAPEHDDCRRIANERHVPLKIVYQAAIAAALRR